MTWETSSGWATLFNAVFLARFSYTWASFPREVTKGVCTTPLERSAEEENNKPGEDPTVPQHSPEFFVAQPPELYTWSSSPPLLWPRRRVSCTVDHAALRCLQRSL